MRGFLLRRTAQSLVTLWLASVLVFAGARARPGAPAIALPASGFRPRPEDPVEILPRLLLPSFVLGTGLAAVLMRQTRSAMLESLSSDYVRTARAKGLSELQVVAGHALRNSLITVVTVVGLETGALISGSVITESIFLVPGFGRLIVEAVGTRDYPIIQAVALASAAGYIALNLAV